MRHDPATLLLYCPVQQHTLDSIAAAAWQAFPLRLTEQLFFYFAPEDASAVSDGASAAMGYLVRFAMDADYVGEFSTSPDAQGLVHFVVPAEEMVEFNYHIVGQLEVIRLLSNP